jgi:hypothetical protein
VKALFLLRLLQSGLWDRGYVSLGRLGQIGGGAMLGREEFLALLRAETGFEDLMPSLEPFLDQLYGHGPDPTRHARGFGRAQGDAVVAGADGS